MAFSKVPSKYQMVSAIVAKMAVLSVAILIFCIRVTLLGLINAEEKKSVHGLFFSWHCIELTGMCLLVLTNLILVGGVVWQRGALLKVWICVHLILVIGQLHVFIVYMLQRLYTECLITLVSTLWIALFIYAVYKCLQLMEKQFLSNDLPLLANENPQ